MAESVRGHGPMGIHNERAPSWGPPFAYGVLLPSALPPGGTSTFGRPLDGAPKARRVSITWGPECWTCWDGGPADGQEGHVQGNGLDAGDREGARYVPGRGAGIPPGIWARMVSIERPGGEGGGGPVEEKGGRPPPGLAVSHHRQTPWGPRYSRREPRGAGWGRPRVSRC